MPARRPDPGLTLGYLADNGYELAVHCPGCDRNARVAVIPLAKRLGYYASMYRAAAMLKCGRCERRGMEVERIKWSAGLPDLPDRWAR